MTYWRWLDDKAPSVTENFNNHNNLRPKAEIRKIENMKGIKYESSVEGHILKDGRKKKASWPTNQKYIYLYVSTAGWSSL